MQAKINQSFWHTRVMNDMKITTEEIDEVINAIHNKKKASEITDLLLDIRLRITKDQ